MAFPWAAVAGLAGSIWSSSQNQASAEASMAFQKEVLQNRNQWMVEDLKKAGLNPILAAGSTSGASAPGATYQTENPAHAAISSAVQAKNMEIAERQQINQDRLTDSNIAKNSADAVRALAQADVYPSETAFNVSSASYNKAKISLMEKEGEEIIARIQELRSNLATAEKQRALLEAKVKEANTSSSRNIAESNLKRKELEIAELRKIGEVEYNTGLKIANDLKLLGVPKAEAVSNFFDDAGTIYQGIKGKGEKFWKGVKQKYKEFTD